jgi:hypothetical protein
MIGGILTVLNLLFVHFFNTIILCFDENLLNFQNWILITILIFYSYSVAKDYVRLMKYGDSLYRCKQLKRAGLGRYLHKYQPLTQAIFNYI